MTLKSLTLLQHCGEKDWFGFEEISAALYQYRILSICQLCSQLHDEMKCSTNASVYLFWISERQKLEIELIVSVSLG